MKKIIIAACAAAMAIFTITACKNESNPTKYTQYKPGIEYKLFKKGNGPTIKDSDFVNVHLIRKIGDSIISSTYRDMGKPFPTQIIKSSEPMSETELYFKMRVGDSIVIRYNKDSIFKGNTPPFVKPQDELLMYVTFASILGKTQVDSIKNAQQSAMAEQEKMRAEMERKQMENAKTLAPKQDAEIQAYMAKNGITGAQKTISGVYYVVTTPGSGPNAANGKTLSMNYTGQLLDGTKFDSNTDPKFNHVQPFEFGLGTGQVIKGWDEGMLNFNKGAKGILIIPSYLAYGENAPPGSPIKPNSILKFDVEVVDIK
jgi:FKBP-type peptidyl-prolyl cis-trans isomerase FkpA